MISIQISLIFILSTSSLFKLKSASEFIISTRSNQTRNENTIECVEHSFDIIINEKLVEYTNIRLNYEIVILNKNDLSIINKLEYASKCLKSIIFKYNRQSLFFKSLPKQIEIKFDLKMKSSIGIGNLDYLKTYSFELAYKQLNGQNEEILINLNEERNFEISTCFGRPGMPENLKCKSPVDNNNYNVLCEWQRSQNVNSPDICYYEILVDENNNGKNMIKYETNENKFEFNGSMNKNFTFYLSAINDAKCYLTFYPVVKQCKYDRVASKYYIVNMQIDDALLTSKSADGMTFRMNIIDSMMNQTALQITSSSTQSMSLYVNKNETNKNALSFFLFFLVFILIKIFILIF
jgi:hypothetical protein